jgi:hypothetical protein
MPTQTYESIQTLVATGSSTSFTFSSIPSTYTDLRIVLSGRVTSAGNDMRMNFNNDSSGYSWTYGATSNGTTTNRGANQTSYIAGYQINPTTTSAFMFLYDINGYSDTSINTSVLVHNYTSGSDMLYLAGNWNNTAVVSTIKIDCTGSVPNNFFIAGSSATLYGLKAS